MVDNPPTTDDVLEASSATIHEDPETGIIHAELAPDPATAEFDLLEIIATLEGTEMDQLPSFYDQVDHLVESMFEEPPSQAAQVGLKFSYCGYRVTLDQQGNVTLVDVKESIPDS